MRFRFDYFAEKVAGGLSGISEKLKDIAASGREAEKNAACTDYADGFLRDASALTGGSYNANHLREILPVIKRTDGNIERERERMDAVLKQCAELKERISDLERKKSELEAVLEAVLSSPDGNGYMLFNNARTNEIQLVNPTCDLKNSYLPDGYGGGEVPAVINIDLATNEVRCYKTTADMEKNDSRYRAIRYSENGRDDFLEIIETYGQRIVPQDGETVLSAAGKYINAMTENQAELLKNVLKSREKTAGEGVFHAVKSAAQDMGIEVSDYSRQIFLRQDNSALVLNYCEEGLAGAYFYSEKGFCEKVYDYREPGFLFLRDLNYQYLLNSPEACRLLQAEGLEISYSEIVTQEADERYRYSDIGMTEPENYGFSYHMSYSEKLAGLMENKRDFYQSKAGERALVSYNPYNNSINFEAGGSVCTITYDEYGKPLDVFCRDGGRLPAADGCVILAGRVLDEEKAGSPEFKAYMDIAGIRIPESTRTERSV